MTVGQGKPATTVGFVGLGGMGTAMVSRLLESGYDVVVWNRSKEPMATVVERGARAADDVTEVLHTRSVLSMLAHDDAFRAIFTPAVLADAPAGCVHVNMATVSVAAGAEFADLHRVAGMGYLAAPVLGRPPVAAAGQLNVLVGGPADLLESIRGPLEALAKKIWHLGDSPTAANTAKIGINYLIIHALQAMAESITLAENSGIDPTLFVELFSNTLFPGPVYSGYGAMMAEGRYSPAGFTTTLGLKDLTLAKTAAQSVGVTLPTADLLSELFADAVNVGPDLDWASIAEVTRRKAAS
jgi:3-hydroxyisobutyrate dehydrogenase-like beta-hydroxyacid dehydrogenase